MTTRPESQFSRRERQIMDIIYAGGCKASDYTQHLLEIVRSPHSVRCPSLAAVAMARKGQFEGRLLAILDGRRNRRTITRLGVVLAAAILAAVAVPLAVREAAGPETKPAATTQPTNRPASASRGEQRTLLAKLKSEEFAAFKARAMDTSLNVDQRLYAVMRAAAVENKEAAEFLAFLWDNPLPIKGVEKGLAVARYRIAEMCEYNPHAEALLRKALRDPSCDVRRSAMRALPTIIGQQAAGLLKERAETDEDAVTRTVATELLRELSDTARRGAQAAIAAAAVTWARSDVAGSYIKGDVVYFVRHDALRGLEGDSLRLYSEWELKAIEKHWVAYRLSSISIRGQRATASLSLYMQPPADPVPFPYCGWRIDLAKVGGQWLAVHAMHNYPWRKPGDDWTRPGYEKEYPSGAELARLTRVAQDYSKKIAPILPDGWSVSTRDNDLLVSRVTCVSWYSTISLPVGMKKADLVSKGFVQSGGYGIYVSFRSPMTPAEAKLLSDKNERAKREYYRDHPSPPTSKPVGPPTELTERLHPVPDMLYPECSVFISTSIQGPNQAFYDDKVRAECSAVKGQVREILSPPGKPAANGAATQPAPSAGSGSATKPATDAATTQPTEPKQWHTVEWGRVVKKADGELGVFGGRGCYRYDPKLQPDLKPFLGQFVKVESTRAFLQDGLSHMGRSERNPPVIRIDKVTLVANTPADLPVVTSLVTGRKAYRTGEQIDMTVRVRNTTSREVELHLYVSSPELCQDYRQRFNLEPANLYNQRHPYGLARLERMQPLAAGQELEFPVKSTRMVDPGEYQLLFVLDAGPQHPELDSQSEIATLTVLSPADKAERMAALKFWMNNADPADRPRMAEALLREGDDSGVKQILDLLEAGAYGVKDSYHNYGSACALAWSHGGDRGRRIMLGFIHKQTRQDAVNRMLPQSPMPPVLVEAMDKLLVDTQPTYRDIEGWVDQPRVCDIVADWLAGYTEGQIPFPHDGSEAQRDEAVGLVRKRLREDQRMFKCFAEPSPSTSSGPATQPAVPATQPAATRPAPSTFSLPLEEDSTEEATCTRHDRYSAFFQPKNHTWRFLSKGTEYKPVRVKFVIMAFEEQCRCVFGCFVSDAYDRAGFSYDSRSAKGFGYGRISDVQAARIDKLMASLPPEPPQVPTDRQLLVSVPQGQEWKTRIYDQANLPVEVLDLSRLSGAGIGTRVVTVNPKSELDISPANGPSEGGLALSPDGRNLVAGGHYNVLKAWDAESFKPVNTFSGAPKLGTVGLAFSPDGKYLAVAEWGKVVVLHAKSGATVTTLTLPKDVLLRGVSFTPDGRFLIAHRYEAFIYRVSDWQIVPQLPDAPQRASRCFQSRDGKWAVVSKADGKLLLWDMAAKKAKATLDTGHYPSLVAFSPDQTRVAVATTKPLDIDDVDPECHIRVWDVKTAKLVCELKPFDIGDFSPVEGLLWSPDGNYVLAGARTGDFFTSRSVMVWNVSTGRHRGDFDGPPCKLTGMALTPDGKTLIAGSEDDKIRLWDFEAGMKRIQAFEATLPALPHDPRGPVAIAIPAAVRSVDSPATTTAPSASSAPAGASTKSVATQPAGREQAEVVTGIDRELFLKELWVVPAGIVVVGRAGTVFMNTKRARGEVSSVAVTAALQASRN